MPTENIVTFNGITRLDLPVERVLESAAAADLEAVLVIGWEKDVGFYFASSYADSAQVIYLLERAKHDLLRMEDTLTAEGRPR